MRQVEEGKKNQKKHFLELRRLENSVTNNDGISFRQGIQNEGSPGLGISIYAQSQILTDSESRATLKAKTVQNGNSKKSKKEENLSIFRRIAKRVDTTIELLPQSGPELVSKGVQTLPKFTTFGEDSSCDNDLEEQGDDTDELKDLKQQYKYLQKTLALVKQKIIEKSKTKKFKKKGSLSVFVEDDAQSLFYKDSGSQGIQSVQTAYNHQGSALRKTPMIRNSNKRPTLTNKNRKRNSIISKNRLIKNRRKENNVSFSISRNSCVSGSRDVIGGDQKTSKFKKQPGPLLLKSFEKYKRSQSISKRSKSKNIESRYSIRSKTSERNLSTTGRKNMNSGGLVIKEKCTKLKPLSLERKALLKNIKKL